MPTLEVVTRKDGGRGDSVASPWGDCLFFFWSLERGLSIFIPREETSICSLVEFLHRE
jgi:hypothetical protein